MKGIEMGEISDVDNKLGLVRVIREIIHLWNQKWTVSEHMIPFLQKELLIAGKLFDIFT